MIQNVIILVLTALASAFPVVGQPLPQLHSHHAPTVDLDGLRRPNRYFMNRTILMILL